MVEEIACFDEAERDAGGSRAAVTWRTGRNVAQG
jgi:hypothetical protein